MAGQSQFVTTNQSFHSMSGSDIRCVIGGKTFAELQGIDVRIKREVAPVYTCGSANVRAWSRGKRAIAGTMTVAFFDRYALDRIMAGTHFSADGDELRFKGNRSTPINSESRNAQGQNIRLQETVFSIADALDPGNDQSSQTPWYADQMPEFNIDILGANEAFQRAGMTIVGCQFVSEGIGMSIDDTMFGYQFQFVARDVAHFREYGAGAETEQLNRTLAA